MSVEGASLYQIQIATDNNFGSSVVHTDTITQTHITTNVPASGRTYFWRLRAISPSDTSTWSTIHRFRIKGNNIRDRLVAYYPLDGSPEDYSGNSDGIIVGDVILAPDRFGNADQAYFLDGDGDYIKFPLSDTFVSIDKQITVSSWVYPRSLAFETGVMTRNFYWYLLLHGDGSVIGMIQNESEELSLASSNLKTPIETWSHIAFTYDGERIMVYLNGKYSGETVFNTTRIGKQVQYSNPTLGRGIPDSWNDFNGVIDEVRVYDRALSRNEITELYRITSTENFPPQIVSFSPALDTVITEGNSLEFSIVVKDEDNKRLFCTWYYDETSISIDTTTNETSAILVHFPIGSVGKHSVKASVSDGELLADTTWSISVKELATGVQSEDNIPTEYLLQQNYPNPFNPSTTISYQLPQAGKVQISVYNIKGQLIKILVDEHRKAGYHSVIWHARGVGSGLYFFRIKASDYVAVKKCIVMK